MNKHMANPRILIDASYIRRMNADGKPFRVMCGQGGRIVLIDTLFYELCSTDDAEKYYPASMRKLRVCPNAIECWTHVPKMWKIELEENRPYGDPLRCEITKDMRRKLANNSQWPLVDIKEEIRKREGSSIVELFQGFANWPQLFSEEIVEEIKSKSGHDEKVVQICYKIVNDTDNIWAVINNIRLIMKKGGLDVLLNPDDVDHTWAIWHFGKSLLVMICDSQRKGEAAFKVISKKTKKTLINTGYDLDYLTSLAFADAIASCETKGEMSYYRRWMFDDDSKPLISSHKKNEIDSVMNKLKYDSTDKISDDGMRVPTVRPIRRLFGALQHDGPAVSVEEMEQAAADGACEE